MSYGSDLAAFLREIDADASTLRHGVRYFVAEQSGDLTPEAMYRDLTARGNSAHIEQILDRLCDDQGLLMRLQLDVLEAAWAEEGTRESARRSLLDAHAKLPVVELGAIVVAAMYGAYLAVTKGRKSQSTTIRYTPDGGFEFTEHTEWHGPGEPMRAIVRALTAGDTAAEPAELPADGET